MTRKTISVAIGDVDNKYVEEVMNFRAKKKVSHIMRIGALAACFCICVMLGVGIWKSGIFDKTELTADGGIAGVEFDGVTWEKTKATVSGKKFSEEEIENYITENSEYIVFVLQKEYDFSIESISIYKNGIYHVSLGENNTVILDSVTLPVLVNGEIYASVSIVRDGRDYVTSINFGGNTWKNYNKILFENPDTEVVFAYLPEATGEIMILPDNTFVNPAVGAVKSPIDRGNPEMDWYSLLKTEYNTLSKSEISEQENLVEIYRKEG